MPRTKHKRKESLPDQIVRTANRDVRKPRKINTRNLIPTGSTLLNLACSDNPFGGFALGKMINLIGDSSSGKTFLALSMFAEMEQLHEYDKYRFIFDDAEVANEFDMVKLFGKKTAKRIHPPARNGKTKKPVYSDTIQDFHANIMKAISEKNPFIYVLDSFDAVTSEEEQKKVRDMIDAREKGVKTKGTYGMEKAKISSQILRMIVGELSRTNSLLCIISQTRDNISPMTFSKKTRSGGRALQFYACHEMWLAVAKKIVNQKRKIALGISCKVKVSKNKITGKVREVSCPIYYDYGVDDIRSCVDWLIQEGFWEKIKDKNAFRAKGLDGVAGTRTEIVEQIEEQNLEKGLKLVTGNAWNKIEEEVKLDRKRKYR